MRRFLICLAVLFGFALQAQAQFHFATRNFIGISDNQVDAKNIAEWAEYWRRIWSKAWLGAPMPDWSRPCPIQIHYVPDSGGVTELSYGGPEVRQRMSISGQHLELEFNVLPHEVTHTVLAHFFRAPAPRWSDEGAATCSESLFYQDKISNRYAAFVAQGRNFPLRTLFNLRDYPHDVGLFYAESHSIAHYLITTYGRSRFLIFVREGMSSGWDRAANQVYGIAGVEALESAWKGGRAPLAQGNTFFPRTPLETRPPPIFAAPPPIMMGGAAGCSS